MSKLVDGIVKAVDVTVILDNGERITLAFSDFAGLCAAARQPRIGRYFGGLVAEGRYVPGSTPA